MLRLTMDSAILILFLIPSIITHSFMLSIQGKNGIRSTGFGTRLANRGALQQNTGIMFDKEISSGSVGPCGRIFGGDNLKPFVVDPQYELSLAELSGTPTADDKTPIQMGVFVHNTDGAGPFTCDYSPDISLKKFYPMKITAQIEGDRGKNPTAKDYVYQLSATFLSNTTCTGGQTKKTCVIRCRNPFGFGSCAAVALDPAFVPTR